MRPEVGVGVPAVALALLREMAEENVGNLVLRRREKENKALLLICPSIEKETGRSLT